MNYMKQMLEQIYSQQVQLPQQDDGWAFSLTLVDVAWLWFKQLKPKFISSFSDLNDAFLTNFIGGKKKLKSSAYLNNIIQKEGELLKDYIKRFNFESLQGVRDKPFLTSLDKNSPITLAEFMACSDKYADAEETRILHEAAQNAKTSTKESTKKEVDSAGGKKRKDDRSRDERRSGKKPDQKFSTRNKNKYCHFHRDHGKNTSDWYNLKQEIERLIRESHLGEHVDSGARATEEHPNDNRPIEDIRTIIGGHLGGGDSSNARKNHARNISHLEFEIMILARPPKERKFGRYSMAFTEEDVRGIHHPYDDALVITVTIANRRVFRVLVDAGSSADMLFT
ncbi:uncharacterized protein LOC131217424 [Magnolia sinica]|uniref:uncharacterized protein LOC131217424 n=1 Tax=Magnolia sinica TaxID=86752 RepID=UPI002657E5B1|nr:uncharacterized protein LOC131217424 [Magnolia sinica]